jgi:TRAP-type C4-dicarboxylate transport system permease small subunit
MGDLHLVQVAKLTGWLIQGLAILGVAAFGAAALVTVVDILGRRIGYPIEGVVDLVQLSVVTGAWLTMPFAFYTATHVTVDFLLAALPASLVIPLKVLGALASFVLVGLMLWRGYLTFETRTMFGDKSQQLGIPIAWYWYPLLVGLAVSLPAILLESVKSIKQELGHE